MYEEACELNKNLIMLLKIDRMIIFQEMERTKKKWITACNNDKLDVICSSYNNKNSCNFQDVSQVN